MSKKTTKKSQAEITAAEQTTIRKLLDEAIYYRDALPYTDEFDRLKQKFEKSAGREISPRDFWQTLARVGKQGTGKKKKTALPVPKIGVVEELEILRLFPDGIGQRDQLPYTGEFEDVYRRFQRHTRRELSEYEFWRLVSRVAKKSRKPKPLFATAPIGGLPPEMVRAIETTNPWWLAIPADRPAPFRRWAYAELQRRLGIHLTPVVAIRGPRQVGKTTLQEQLIEELLLLRGVPAAHILRVQFDKVPSLGLFEGPLLAIVKWFEERVLGDSINGLANSGRPVYLFFDELQNIEAWDPQLKFLADHYHANIVVTGSSALRIARAQDSLAGRLSTINLGPLQLREIAGIRRLGELPPFRPQSELGDLKNREFWLELIGYSHTHGDTLKKAFREFSAVGGYPACHAHTSATMADLTRLVTDTVVNRTLMRDVAVGPERGRLDPRLLEETFRRVCRYTGQAVRVDRIAEEVAAVIRSKPSSKQVQRVIQFLTDSMLIHEIAPLEMLLKKQRHPSKLCLCDHFIRQAWLQETIPLDPEELRRVPQAVAGVAGHIVEGIIGYYLKGIPGLEVSWFPERAEEPEIDYVLTVGDTRIPVEIKYKQRKPTRADTRGIQSFCDKKHYHADFGLIITQDTAGEIGPRTLAIPAYAFLCVQ